jgi:hypothetical protein
MIFALASLATYRLSRMITDEEGPFAVFTTLRRLYPPTDWVGRGLECIMCVSVWVSLLATALVTMLGYADAWLWPLTWLAMSAVTVLIRKWEQKK